MQLWIMSTIVFLLLTSYTLNFLLFRFIIFFANPNLHIHKHVFSSMNLTTKALKKTLFKEKKKFKLQKLKQNILEIKKYNWNLFYNLTSCRNNLSFCLFKSLLFLFPYIIICTRHSFSFSFLQKLFFEHNYSPTPKPKLGQYTFFFIPSFGNFH